jgi:hypothetical protein
MQERLGDAGAYRQEDQTAFKDVAPSLIEGFFLSVCTAVFGTFIIVRIALVKRANSGLSGGFFMGSVYIILQDRVE